MSNHLQPGQHPDADQISAFVDHALPVHEREEMFAHLAECDVCRHTVALSLPEIETTPAAAKRSRFRLPGLAIFLPATVAALAALLIYVEHTAKLTSESGKRGPDIALQTPVAPMENEHVPSKAAGGSAGSSSVAQHQREVPGRRAQSSALAMDKDRGLLQENRPTNSESRTGFAFHLPSGAIPITAVTRGRQVLAIDDRNGLFLSNDSGKSWTAVQAPWKGKVVKAQLVLAPTSAVMSDSARASVNQVIQTESESTSDATQFRAQKSLRQELKGSYQAPGAGGGAASSPASAPAVAATVPKTLSATGATLSGVVDDRSGAVISGASVVLSKPGDRMSWTAVTGDDGRYLISGLAPGTYHLEAHAHGFNATVSPVQVSGSDTSKNVTLDVGTSSQTVTVQSAAPEIEPTLPELNQNTIAGKQKSAYAGVPVRPIPAFEITTDSGEHWISEDGATWRHQ